GSTRAASSPTTCCCDVRTAPGSWRATTSTGPRSRRPPGSSGRRPPPPPGVDGDGEHGARGPLLAVLAVARREGVERGVALGGVVDLAGPAPQADPPQQVPAIVVVVVDDERHVGVGGHVAQPAQRG